MWWNHMLSSSTWIAVMVLMALAFGGLAWLITLALRAEYRPESVDPRRVLDARLARGEIDPSEYRERISALTEARDA